MSSKGGSSSSTGSASSSAAATGNSSSDKGDIPWTEGGTAPTIVSGHQYHQYSQGSYGSERYAYIGKDEVTREPEFIDYGPKGGK
mmetsp:Transcript_24742/g.34750  ORF Transcript_24742/g.34750 Transcript_24742/m.34750 type:complete len:85 (+) Transcript_24742:28-282(+)